MNKVMMAVTIGMLMTVASLGLLGGCAAPAAPEPAADAAAEFEQLKFKPIESPNSDIYALMEENEEFQRSTEGSYIQNQAILMGFRDDVVTVAERMSFSNADNMPFITFGFLAETGEAFLTPLGFLDGDRGLNEFVIALATTHKYENLPNVLQTASEMLPILLGNGDISAPVLVEANYSIPTREIQGDPHSVGGHPTGSVLEEDLQMAFQQQWALGNDAGIGLYSSTNDSRTVSETGRGARIMIFDTSPYAQYEYGSKKLPTSIFEALSIDANPADNPILVSHPFLLLNSGASNVVTASHGLFVLGLTLAVAPEANLELIRVLDDDTHGDLFRLLDVMVSTLMQRIDFSSKKSPKIVFNLSLGTLPPSDVHDTELVTSTKSLIHNLYVALPDETRDSIFPDGEPIFSPHVPIFSLATVIHITDQLGVIVVAAGGNGSMSMPAPKSSEYPAIYGNVLGVAASTDAGSRSCFSNSGDVAAPGGDGDPNCDPRVNVFKQCVDEGKGSECPYGLISTVLVDNTVEEYGFAYWNGTSFATPLVSGLAALSLGAGMSPIETVAAIKSEVCLPAADSNDINGIVNVPLTLGKPGVCPY